MGDRGNVQIVFENGSKIFLYTHWHGSDLDRITANALKRGESRWGDEPYLSRIIFSQMLLEAETGALASTTGFGISPTRGDYNRADVVVNMAENRVFSPDVQFDGTFAEYVEEHATE